MDKLVNKINELILRISKGDDHALDELFSLTKRMLLFMARKYLYDKSYAEDVLIETYYKIVKYSSSFDKNKNGLNWIFKILHNEAINFNRKNNSFCECKLDDNICPIECVDELLDKIVVRDALLELTDEEKTILYWRYWEGLDIKTIADKTNKPLSSTFDEIKRIQKKLHRILK